jgi:hypothetical protein
MMRARTEPKPRPLRIACVGHAALDHVFEVEQIPGGSSKTLARRYQALAGGMALHASIAAARLQMRARHGQRRGADTGRARCLDAWLSPGRTRSRRIEGWLSAGWERWACRVPGAAKAASRDARQMQASRYNACIRGSRG